MNNTSSVFISYSHANESCLNEFKVHLANLIRTKRIEPWYDRFLLGGDKLDQKILDKLSRSDIVIFLVSPEFIDSYYCYEKELKVAIENRENGASRVFPIILDHCDWKGSDILKQCVLLPRDAKPVSTFENKNEAYLHIVDELRRVLDELDKEQLREPVRTQLPIEISSVFAEYLNDTEIVFQNSNVSEIKLENIFVFPDLKSIILDEKAADVISHSHEMIDSEHWSDTDKLILGGEQSGKTSLAKTAFKSLYLKGYLPVIIDCSEIGSKLDVQKDLRKFIDRQYTIEDIENFEYSRAVVILDDFHLLKFNSKYRALYLSEIEKISKNGKLIFADSDLRFEESTFNIFENFERYEILRFGYVKRDELINKWNSLGVEETIEEADLQKLNDSKIGRAHV